MFVILVSPFEIRAIYYYFNDRASSPKQFAISLFVFQVTRHIFLLNYGSNFFLYLASGSKFRKDLRKLCGRKTGLTQLFQLLVQQVAAKQLFSRLQIICDCWQFGKEKQCTGEADFGTGQRCELVFHFCVFSVIRENLSVSCFPFKPVSYL